MSPETWYYVQDGASVGPLPRAAVDALIRSGTIIPATLVSPGYGDWVPAGSSALASMFMTTPPPGAKTDQPPAAKKDYLPKNPTARLAVRVAMVLLGGYAMYSGFNQMQDGMSELSGDTSVTMTGCIGVSADAVQCGFQNMAQASRTMCLDVVIMCNDGRHVASTCSDPIMPGASSTKLVNNFAPAIDASMTCANISYENVKTKG